MGECDISTLLLILFLSADVSCFFGKFHSFDPEGRIKNIKVKEILIPLIQPFFRTEITNVIDLLVQCRLEN